MLYADLAAQNAGQYFVDAPLIVAIDHLSDPSVRVRGADGMTPDGLPYFDLTALVPGGKLAAGDSTATRTIAFSDPSGIPFTYDLVFLGQLNLPPQFTSAPKLEAIVGNAYVYNATASDPENDPLTFSLLSGPSGMTVDASTGAVTWSPASTDVGNAAVALRVDDGHGGSGEQDFTLSVSNPPPDRPPVFTSTPVVDANVSAPYAYQAKATDPDSDPLAFSVVSGPQGLTVDATTGLVSWTPTVAQIGPKSVTLQVADGRGGTAVQTYTIAVGQQAGNEGPVITSTPVTQFNIPPAGNADYIYTVRAVDPDGDPLTFSLTSAPAGANIDAQTGEIQWSPQVGQFPFTVRVDDGRGGFGTQNFTLNVTADPPGKIQGTVFNDANGDGSRDLIGGNPAPVTLLNVPGTADIYLAGMPAGSTTSAGDSAPAQAPFLVTGLTLSAGEALMFTVPAGAVNNTFSTPTTPDGNGSFTNHTAGAENGISDVVAPANALVGLFLGPDQPDGSAAPPQLDFRPTGNVSGSINYTSLAPQLRQVFFIGDGRTSSGALQQIIAPPGATRLYLGVMADGATASNFGSFAVAVQPYDPAKARVCSILSM